MQIAELKFLWLMARVRLYTVYFERQIEIDPKDTFQLNEFKNQIRNDMDAAWENIVEIQESKANGP